MPIDYSKFNNSENSDDEVNKSKHHRNRKAKGKTELKTREKQARNVHQDPHAYFSSFVQKNGWLILLGKTVDDARLLMEM